MALINCPECSKQISEKAPACPHCGCPVVATSHGARPQQVIIQQPQRLNTGSGLGKLIGCLIVVAVAAFLAFTNPSEADMRTRIAKDGWVPVDFERTNLILFNWVNITGFTGAKGKYLGIAGQIIKLKEG